MERREQAQNEASQAVIALRKALDMTQQAFATKIKTAVTTVARWETNNPPPRGETLLKLARIAKKHHYDDLCRKFVELYLDDVVAELPMAGIDRRRPDGTGYVLYRYNNRREAEDGVRIIYNYACRLAADLPEGPVIIADLDPHDTEEER